MSDKFTEREKSFEKKFAKDQELQFKVAARSSKYLSEFVFSVSSAANAVPIVDEMRTNASIATSFIPLQSPYLESRDLSYQNSQTYQILKMYV